jgi:hypothetical protein
MIDDSLPPSCNTRIEHCFIRENNSVDSEEAFDFAAIKRAAISIDRRPGIFKSRDCDDEYPEDETTATTHSSSTARDQGQVQGRDRCEDELNAGATASWSFSLSWGSRSKEESTSASASASLAPVDKADGIDGVTANESKAKENADSRAPEVIISTELLANRVKKSQDFLKQHWHRHFVSKGQAALMPSEPPNDHPAPMPSEPQDLTDDVTHPRLDDQLDFYYQFYDHPGVEFAASGELEESPTASSTSSPLHSYAVKRMSSLSSSVVTAGSATRRPKVIRWLDGEQRLSQPDQEDADVSKCSQESPLDGARRRRDGSLTLLQPILKQTSFCTPPRDDDPKGKEGEMVDGRVDQMNTECIKADYGNAKSFRSNMEEPLYVTRHTTPPSTCRLVSVHDPFSTVWTKPVSARRPAIPQGVLSQKGSAAVETSFEIEDDGTTDVLDGVDTFSASDSNGHEETSKDGSTLCDDQSIFSIDDLEFHLDDDDAGIYVLENHWLWACAARTTDAALGIPTTTQGIRNKKKTKGREKSQRPDDDTYTTMSPSSASPSFEATLDPTGNAQDWINSVAESTREVLEQARVLLSKQVKALQKRQRRRGKRAQRNVQHHHSQNPKLKKKKKPHNTKIDARRAEV